MNLAYEFYNLFVVIKELLVRMRSRSEVRTYL